MHTEHVETTIDPQPSAAHSPQPALWQTIAQLAETEQERAVLRDSFAYGLPPRSILARHPDLFPDVVAIYAAKRDLLERLQRHGTPRELS